MADGGDIRGRARRAADLFCGAGGLSTGLRRAMRELGKPLHLTAVNHWEVAIATHSKNHPEARHYCADLESARPLDLVPEGSLDLLAAAPSCVFHSRARGGRPVHDQQRMDPWHVVRWCTELRVKRILVENVPEFVDWGPCSLVTGRPIPSRKGEYFRAWCDALRSIGFRIDFRILCSADFGDPTTRTRFFLIGRSDRGPLRWPEPTHARGGAEDLLDIRKPWRAAAEIIDWNLPGKSIFGRKKPLKPNTIRRILAGAIRYAWPQPYIDALQALLDGREPVLDVPAGEVSPMLVRLRGTNPHALDGSALPIDGPLPTLSAGGGHVGLVMATGAGGVARDLAQPIPTVTSGGDGGARPHLIVPLVLGVANSSRARDATAEPMPTITTGGASAAKRKGNARPALVEPIIVNRCNSEGGRTARPVSEPAPTVATAGGGYLAQPLIGPYYGSGSGTCSKPVTEPLPTVATVAGLGLAEPILMRAGHGDSDGRDPASRVLDADYPLPALTGSNEVAIAQPAVIGYRIDILYRMLFERELFTAQGFRRDYIIDRTADGRRLTRTQAIRMCGNSVSPPPLIALARANLDAVPEAAAA